MFLATLALLLTVLITSRGARTPESVASVNDQPRPAYDLTASATGRRWMQGEPSHWRAYMLKH